MVCLMITFSTSTIMLLYSNYANVGGNLHQQSKVTAQIGVWNVWGIYGRNTLWNNRKYSIGARCMLSCKVPRIWIEMHGYLFKTVTCLCQSLAFASRLCVQEDRPAKWRNFCQLTYFIAVNNVHTLDFFFKLCGIEVMYW